MIIRDETNEDVSAVRRVVTSAFGQAAEADLVDALRRSGDVVISRIASADGGVIGHILFSQLQAPVKCLALAPVSVIPERQGRGIGSALIRDGLAQARKDGWQAIFVLGEPAYYQRFGFSVALADKFETPYPKPYFMALDLASGALDARDGPVIYAPAFLELE